MRVFSACDRRFHPFLILGLAAGIAACYDGSGESSGPGVTTSDGALRGQLILFTARLHDGSFTSTYFLRPGGNELDQRELVFRTAPDVRPMSEVKVWGTDLGGRIAVDRLEVVPPADGVESRTAALIGAAPLAPTRLVMAIIDLGAGTNVTPEVLNQRVFTNADSIKAYYLENSFGMQDLTGMVMPTPFQHTMTTCDMTGVSAKFRPMIEAATGQTFDIYLWYFGQQTDLCGFSGAASGRDTFYNGSSSCVVLVQEPGHSLGLSHSASLVCPSATMADDPNTCTHNEYGNRYDTMGGGCRHFSAYHKVYRNYLQKCNGVKVRSTGTFTLLPIEQACNGIQVLQVPMPKTRPFMTTGGGGGNATTNLAYYLVELRAPIGFDRTMTPSVVINASADFRVSGAGQGSGQHIWLLDAALATTTGTNGAAHALGAGQTFTDPAGGVSITTEAVSATSATVRVTIDGAAGANTCLDGTAIAAPGPATCGEGAGGATGTGGAGTGGRGGSGGAATGTGGAGTGGRGGSGGAATGTGGRGGSGGAATGTGGAGTGGRGGSGGAATGTGGAGAPGSGGTGAGVGSGGASVGATGGSPASTGGTPAGQAGASGTGGGPGVTGTTPTLVGCNCAVSGRDRSGLLPLAACALAALFTRRRRRQPPT